MVVVSTYSLKKVEINIYYLHLKTHLGGHFHYGVEMFTGLVEVITINISIFLCGGSFHLFIEEDIWKICLACDSKYLLGFLRGVGLKG